MYYKKPKKGAVKKFKAGRICKKIGCKQRLSIYNSKDYCHLHQNEFMK